MGSLEEVCHQKQSATKRSLNYPNKVAKKSATNICMVRHTKGCPPTVAVVKGNNIVPHVQPSCGRHLLQMRHPRDERKNDLFSVEPSDNRTLTVRPCHFFRRLCHRTTTPLIPDVRSSECLIVFLAFGSASPAEPQFCRFGGPLSWMAGWLT